MNVYSPQTSKFHSKPVREKETKYKEKTTMKLPSATHSFKL